MNGRPYPATAVDRSAGPVLAWNVEPTQFPSGAYPEMPAAAAAAVSPVVPAAATAQPDPYGRCWQSQVDPSACFPYFGTLYGSSLPPPSYRMQPGCLSNLGQFWPPTPPPEGCVRYDGTNNLHYCSPLTPVFRHGESLPQNMLGVHQRLGHYSHLIDVNKDSGLKRMDSCLDGIQRQKVLLGSKHTKEVPQRSCSCYECNEKNFARGTPQSVNKENISSGKLLEPKLSEDKQKLKLCKRGKDESYSLSRSSSAYHPNASAISNYSCSVEQNVTRTTMSVQGPNQSDFLVHNPRKLESPVSTNSCVRHDFLRPESNSFPISRCASNSLMSVPSSKEVTQVVQSAPKSTEHSRYDSPPEKLSRHKVHVSSGFEACPCPPVQSPSGSSSLRSTEKSCCFSPPYMSSRTLYNNYPETSTHSKAPNMMMLYGNSYNASPLKNVYFSYFESENFDMGSGGANRKNKDSFCKQERVSSVGSFDNHAITPSSSQSGYVAQSVNNVSPVLSSNMHHIGHYDGSNVPSDAYQCVYQSSCIEQEKASNTKYLGSTAAKRSESSSFSDQVAKISSVQVKQEKLESSDCKFQKSHRGSGGSRLPQLSDTVAANGVLNLSTSLRCPKVEPDDQINTSSMKLVRTSTSMPVSCPLTDALVRNPPTPSAQSRSLSLPVDGSGAFYSSVPSAGHLIKCHRVPDATTPQMHELESDCTAAAVPEDLCPVAQIALSGGAELAGLSKMPTTGHEAPTEVGCQSAGSKGGSEIEAPRDEDSSGLASLCLTEPVRSPFREVCQLPKSSEAHTGDCFKASDLEVASVGDNDPLSSLSNSALDALPEQSVVLNKQNSDVDVHKDINVSIKIEDQSSEMLVAVDCSDEYQASTLLPSVKSESEDISKEAAIPEKTTECPNLAEEQAVEEYHGLYILLQGIACKKSIDSSLEEQMVIKRDDGLDEHLPIKMDCSTPADSSPDAISTKMKGLSLLCALAEEQFFVEFGNNPSCKVEVGVSDGNGTANLSSNYPVVKEENEGESAVQQSGEESDKKTDITIVNAELQMRQRLAELQQKYREKQKELARLKPKKMKSLSNSDISNLMVSPCESSVPSPSTSKVVSNDENEDKTSVKAPVLDTDSNEKQVKYSFRSGSKSSSDENGALSTQVQQANTNRAERKLSRTASKCMQRRSVTRRRVEMSRNLRANVLSRKKSSSRRKASSSSTSFAQTESDISDEVKAVTKRQKKFCRHRTCSSERNANECNKSKSDNSEDLDMHAVQLSMRSPKKRKPENPKRFMPAKQVRLTETIIAKQLRNRILFETPGCVSKKADEKRYDVPEELFDALRKCNLGDGGQLPDEPKSQPTMPAVQEMEQEVAVLKQSSNVVHKILRMTTEHLLENQRILALEEGLFYAGTIKEIQSADVYSIVLDGQRGNKKHLFSKEEMLTQTILESKPMSLDELPEGTRICAFWSHQYRCLYPGTVVRAPAPSPDWSEPRVYVEFDDGDSAQIAMKNIRFLPPDLQLSEDDSKGSVLDSKGSTSESSKRSSASPQKRKTSTKDLRKHSKLRKTDFRDTKANTSCSNDSNAEDCCRQKVPDLSPSHRLEQEVSLPGSTMGTKVSRRTQRQLSKKRSGSKNKVKEMGSLPEKSKKHKRYKDRHKHHHHHRHHHRHHRHCHHHRHCKKRKHHKRASNVDNIINVVIPSSSIPYSNLIAKSTRSSMKDAEAQCVGHSKKDSKQLPQPGGESGDSKSDGNDKGQCFPK